MTQDQALAILQTGANIFLTGEPGSGKTHTINQYVRYLQAAKVPVAITASTGIAATHIGGMTIHSWSGIGIKKYLSPFEIDRIASTERIVKRIAKTAVLVIDEISMLEAATLDSIDRVCRAVKQSDYPFGGMQVIFVGDFFQLPPVSRYGEEAAQFAFLSQAWQEAKPLICYLSEQHRQEDSEFLRLLSAMRQGNLTQEYIQYLDERCQMPETTAGDGLTKLFSHNVDVDRLNSQELRQIAGKEEVFAMDHSGQKPLVEQIKKGCLSPETLALKEKAVVMFTKNSPQGKFVNGTLAQVVDFQKVTRYPIVMTTSGRRIVAEPMDWTVEDNGRILASVTQVPLRLAWAITIHKSQGMSLDAAYMDLRQVFVPGQGYVALSRVRTLKGLFLAGYNSQALQVHPEVLACDESFRQLSEQARDAFAQLPAKELTTMHRNFIKAAGGAVK
jgi:ATP-dependent exoDNAse (exonuclease V) alpha subunit